MLWVGIVIISAITLAILVIPSLLGRRQDSADSRKDYDAAVYRDQLAELDRDLERGLISETEAETARIEIQRRLLAAVDAETEQTHLIGSGNRFVIPTLSMIAFVGAVVLYLELGSPNTPDFPYAERGDLDSAPTVASSAHSVDEAIAQLEARLKENPDDPEGWATLGRSYLSMEKYLEAQKAFLKLYEITGDIMAKAEYAEALILASDSQITPEALDIFDEVLRVDPYDPKSRFYFGVAAAQQGNLSGALQIWTDLLHLSPPDAPWIDIVQRQIIRAADEAGVDPASVAPTEQAIRLALDADIESSNINTNTTQASPGPSQEDIENAQQMSADEQMEMIRSMVQRLADRLEENPDDYEGWLRLAQAYEVLGETEKAEEARRRAAEAAP